MLEEPYTATATYRVSLTMAPLQGTQQTRLVLMVLMVYSPCTASLRSDLHV